MRHIEEREYSLSTTLDSLSIRRNLLRLIKSYRMLQKYLRLESYAKRMQQIYGFEKIFFSNYKYDIENNNPSRISKDTADKCSK